MTTPLPNFLSVVVAFRASYRRCFCWVLGLLSWGFTVFIHPAHATLPGVKAVAPFAIAQTTATPPIATLDAGRTLYHNGQFAEAAQVWQSTAASYRRQGDRSNEALSLSYLSLAYQALNQWAAAQQAIDQSLTLLRTQPTADAILWAQTLNTEAKLLQQQGKVEAALERWQQAQTYYERAGDFMGSLGSRINQAHALQSLGFYRRSRQQLETVNQTLKPLPNSELKVSGLRSLGAALQTIGATEAAQQALTQGLAIARQLETKPELSSLLQTLGKNALDLDDPNTAMSYFEQAEAVALTPIEQVQARLQQFKLFADYAIFDQAGTLAPQILQQLQALPASRTSLYSTIHFAASLNKLEQPGQLVSLKAVGQLLANTVQAANQLQDQSAAAYALVQWGQLYRHTGQVAEARTLTQQALQLARQLRADDLIAQSAWQLGQLQTQQGDRQGAIATYTEAVKALQAIRVDLIAVNPDVQFSYRKSVEPVYRELVELLLDGQPSQNNLHQARNLIESLQIAELDNFFREACLDKAQQIDQIDPTATVIYPILLPDRLAVIISTAGQPLRYYATRQPQATIDQTLTQLLAALNPVSNIQDRDRLSHQVYDWLIKPAEQDQAFQQTKTLVFVLDGKLRNIPMAALYDGQQYLIEKYAVTLSPGLQLMAAQSLQPRDRRLIIGGISQARAGFAALPAVETEIQSISQMLPAATLLNQQFTGAALADQVKHNPANVVHLATHGQFSSRIDDTFLLTWDGRISVKELSESLQKRQGNAGQGLELLVLSACDTATGDDRAVLGLAGLAVKSGAHSTLASLWPVKDKAASLLMTHFYQALQTPATTKAEALRQAQIDLISQSDFHDPFFWAAFVLVGNWQ